MATIAINKSGTVAGAISNTSLTTAQLASHSHPMAKNPEGPQSGGEGKGIMSNVRNSPRNAQSGYEAAMTNTTPYMENAGSGTGHNHSHTLSGTLTGNITTSLTGTVTAAGTNSFSPFVVVNYIIKH